MMKKISARHAQKKKIKEKIRNPPKTIYGNYYTGVFLLIGRGRGNGQRVYMAGSGAFANARTRTHIRKSMTSSKNQKIGKIRKIDDVIKKSENQEIKKSGNR